MFFFFLSLSSTSKPLFRPLFYERLRLTCTFCCSSTSSIFVSLFSPLPGFYSSLYSSFYFFPDTHYSWSHFCFENTSSIAAFALSSFVST